MVIFDEVNRKGIFLILAPAEKRALTLVSERVRAGPITFICLQWNEINISDRKNVSSIAQLTINKIIKLMKIWNSFSIP